MPILDDVKLICDRLGPLGFRDLLLEVTAGALDIAQPTTAALRAALAKPLSSLDRTVPGFEDLHPAAASGIRASRPAESVLYHALASPSVSRGASGALLRGFPTLREIEVVEDCVFAFAGASLASIVADAGGEVAVVVFATEYREAASTAHGAHADLTFSRTGVARIGTSGPRYRGESRGHWPEDEDDAHGFRVIPVRLTTWLAARASGADARVMRGDVEGSAADEAARSFWVPIHKLFDGDECLMGLDLKLQASARFFNLKLQRVRLSLGQAVSGAPFVVEHGLATLEQSTDRGRLVVVPVVQEALVRAATDASGEPLVYRVPPNAANAAFATYQTPDDGAQRFPAYVHARTRVLAGVLVDLNELEDVGGAVAAGDYDALHYADATGEGWVDVSVPAIAGAPGVAASSRAAYVLLGAPDFFPATGQGELARWSRSKRVPSSLRKGIWGVAPAALHDVRLPANLQLPGSPFDPDDDTVTAVVAMPGSAVATPRASVGDPMRASTLPDDAAGVFAPGWDVSVDLLDGVEHLAGYALGSPFPEDAKLCAALSTFWPAVAPDVYRGMSMHTGNAKLRGSVAPLTDEEIGQSGALPWDGVSGPVIVVEGGVEMAEMASFLHVDYTANLIESRFSVRLTSRIGADEYERRVLAAARVHRVLGGASPIAETRPKWLFLSFRAVSSGDSELHDAQGQAGHVLEGVVYRVEVCFVGGGDASLPSPKGPRFRRLPLRQRSGIFVSATDRRALRRRATDAAWAPVAAE